MFSTPEQNIKPKVFHFEDHSSSEMTEDVVGRKGSSLFRLHDFDIPVPEFFVISSEVFSSFVKRVLTEKEKELTVRNPEYRDIQNIFSRYDFDEDVQKEISNSYTRISGFTDSWVSVRSSVIFPQSPTTSFSGVFTTKLNVRGVDGVMKAVKEVYASFFTDAVVMYAVKEGIELADVKLAVVVQKMVHAEVSGIAFTVDPITQDSSKMGVEAVFGLGDVIANGEITPDTYHLNKKDLQIYEKHIAPQEWMRVRNISDSKLGGYQKVSISPAWSHRQKLDDRSLKEVCKIALIIEEKEKSSVDVEWVVGGGRVWVLQIKRNGKQSTYSSNHVQYGGYSYVTNTVLGVIKEIVGREVDGKRAVTEATKLVEKQIEKPQPTVEKIEEKKEDVKDSGIASIVSGIGASFGQIKGVALVPSSPLVNVDRKNVLVLKDFDRSYSDLVFKAGGIVCETGGVTSDIAILCRELGIPAVVGAKDASNLLATGNTVQIDGNTGSVYKLDEGKIERVEVAQNIAEKLEEPMEDPVVVQKNTDIEILDLPRTATKVLVCKKTNLNITSEVVNSDGIAMINLDGIMLKKERHPAAILSEGRYKAYGEEISRDLDEIIKSMDPKEVVVVIGMGRVRRFKDLVKGKEFESEKIADDAYGVQRYLANPKALEVALRIVRRIRNIHHHRNVSLGVYAPSNGAQMREIKKDISAGGLRRTGTFNIYAVIENPGGVIMVDEILGVDIDGIILDTPMLARYIFNLPKESKNVVYDLNSNSILKIVDSVVSTVKGVHKRIIVQCEKDKDFIKYCVNKGVYGVIVDEEIVVDTKKLVHEQEAKIILSVK